MISPAKNSEAVAKAIRLLTSGSQTDFATLYDSYNGSLFSILCRMLPSQEVAQDILQDAFIKIWRNAKQYDPTKGNPFTWMLNIARNQAIDWLRAQARRGGPEIHSDENFVDRGDEQARTTAEILDAIAKLPDDLRVVFDMVYYRGYSQAEVADKLNIPLGTIKTKCRNALIKMRELL